MALQSIDYIWQWWQGMWNADGHAASGTIKRLLRCLWIPIKGHLIKKICLQRWNMDGEH